MDDIWRLNEAFLEAVHSIKQTSTLCLTCGNAFPRDSQPRSVANKDKKDTQRLTVVENFVLCVCVVPRQNNVVRSSGRDVDTVMDKG